MSDEKVTDAGRLPAHTTVFGADGRTPFIGTIVRPDGATTPEPPAGHEVVLTDPDAPGGRRCLTVARHGLQVVPRGTRLAYAVFGECGEYDSAAEWPVAVLPTREAADRLATRLNDWLVANLERLKSPDGWKLRPAADAGFRFDPAYPESSRYTAGCVPVYPGAPAVAEGPGLAETMER